MCSRNALRWVISAIPLLPLPYNSTLQVSNTSELRGDLMTWMCPRFPVHYLALLQSQKPQVLMAISFTCRLCQLLTGGGDSLGPTVHAHARPICLCLFVCHWKALVKPDVPIKISSCHREWEAVEGRVMERQRYFILIKRRQNGGCGINSRIMGWQQRWSRIRALIYTNECHASVNDRLTGSDLIPTPESSAVDLFNKNTGLFFPPWRLADDTLDICIFHWRLCALNAANEDESAATAGRATVRVVIQIGCARACPSDDL